MAPCFTDTNDLTLDPATTTEDTQHTAINTFSYWLCLSISPSVLLSFYLSCLSFSLLSLLSSRFLISSSCVIIDVISLCHFYHPNAFYTYHLSICTTHPFPSCLNYSLCPSQSLSLSLSLSFFFFFHPSFSPSPPSLSLSSQQLHCPWVRANNVSPHGAPVQSQPRRQGAPENTHNSMFQLGCGIKGSLTHGWLCGSVLDHL